MAIQSIKSHHGDPGEDATARIVTAIEADILLGKLRPRERLIEESLALRFRVNRSVVRCALLDLGSLGLVTREPFRGAKVRDYALSEIEEICELREVLLTHALLRIAAPIPADIIAAIACDQKAHATAVENRELMDIYRFNASFHSRIHALCGNQRLAKELDHLSWLLTVVRAYRFQDASTMVKAVAGHEAILTALRAGDTRLLTDLSLKHMAKPHDIFRSIQDWSASVD
jgi:DNA-binding GntR family transcriptional regulator